MTPIFSTARPTTGFGGVGSRRRLLQAGLAGGGLGLALAGTPARGGILGLRALGVNAQDATDRRLAGFPRLRIVLSPERIEAPTHAEPGLHLLVQENRLATPGHSFVLRVPDDVAEEDLAAALGPDAKPAREETPEWFWRAEFVGNPDRAAAGGGLALGLVDLAPGRYVVGDPYRAPAQFARFEVSGEIVAPPAMARTIPVDIAAEMREMAFAMPAELGAGRRLWQVRNAGAMFHELAILPVPAEATVEQVQAALGAILEAEASGAIFEETVAPASLGPDWAGWTPELVAGVGITSPQRNVIVEIDLAPGSYAAVCFVPLPTDFTRHLMLGMVARFAVTA